MRFEWDERKRQSNMAKHGLELPDAEELFDGRPVLTTASQRGDELRFVTVGLVAGLFVAVVWTERVDVIRLISLRRARDGEKRAYRARHGGGDQGDARPR
jgi:uncharacterized DUF497 family protein